MELTLSLQTIFFLAVLFYTTVVSAVIYVCIEMPWLASEKLLFASILGSRKGGKKN